MVMINYFKRPVCRLQLNKKNRVPRAPYIPPGMFGAFCFTKHPIKANRPWLGGKRGTTSKGCFSMSKNKDTAIHKNMQGGKIAVREGKKGIEFYAFNFQHGKPLHIGTLIGRTY